MQLVRPSGITVAQIARSQPHQLLHVSGLQSQAPVSQIITATAHGPTQTSQALPQATPVSSVNVQMITGSANITQQTPTLSNVQQMSSGVAVSQPIQMSSNSFINQLSGLPPGTQTSNGKLAFVQQPLLIQGQQPGQQNALINPQQQQALILQRRGPHPQQRILLQQQLVTQGGVTTTHWRTQNMVRYCLFHKTTFK